MSHHSQHYPQPPPSHYSSTEMQSKVEPEKCKYQQLAESYDQVVETLEELKQPEVSSSEANSLRKELAAKTEEAVPCVS